MKFAIPLAEGKLTAHFGHCQKLSVLNRTGDCGSTVGKPSARLRWRRVEGNSFYMLDLTIYPD